MNKERREELRELIAKRSHRWPENDTLSTFSDREVTALLDKIDELATDATAIWHHSQDRVLFDFDGVRDSKPSRIAIGGLTLEKKLFVTDAFRPSGGDWSIRAWIRHEDVGEAVKRMKAFGAIYRGANFFCSGAITRKYDTPEAELANEPGDAWEKHQKGECLCHR